MATVLLVRHGRTTANASGLLAGRMPGVELDGTGLEQARRAAARVADVGVIGVVSSPQQRCRQTARLIAAAQPDEPTVEVEGGLAECDYGEWQGSKLAHLAKRKLWQTVQHQPSAVTFPGGESLVAMQHRAVAAVRRRDAEVTETHGEEAVWVAVSHGDLIKSVLADALGLHLDLFQRLHVDPASISIISYSPDRPQVLATNSHAGDLGWLASRRGRRHTRGSTVGGGAGPAPHGS